ncbi:FAD-dependent oxidoreductase [Novosphingobium aquiterrae]|uniref:FAD-dependent oxidoreductase n=1 Tax=Novosphingobium aquiterrae TaxID=624388 RepID=A0ABV6PEJ1_9SPHN
MTTRTVAIFGGGVAGLSAAHELAERSGAGVDFEIHVYERRAEQLGGKARSIWVPHSARDGRDPLPGEHGFRFFPGFYKHLPDTMERIPTAHGSVFDNLVVADRLEVARFGAAPIVISARFPKTLSDLVTDIEAMFSNTGLLPGEARFFAERLWQVLTSCQDRRLAEYEGITWWNFLDADNHSPAYRNLLVDGLSRSLLANDPSHASVRTVGDTNIQLILGMVSPTHPTDRLLDGPTSKVWIEPWRAHLESLGVQFHHDTAALQFGIADGACTGVEVITGQTRSQVSADAYVFALPVERMTKVLSASKGRPDDPLAADPALPGVVAVSQNVRWMNGIQFFLYKDVPITHGHLLFADTPWALTGISEAQFWSDEHLPGCGDGTVNGILSACISEWDAPGILFGKTALQCSRQEIAQEVWAQIKASVNVGGTVLLEDDNVHSHFLDPDLVQHPDGTIHLSDAEPLFVNFINSWVQRPAAVLQTRNLMLASDYVQTFTDVACMEAANEAARRAVNGVLDLFGSSAAPCELWPLHEPAIFAPFRRHDQARFDRGLPWDGHLL